MTLIVSLRIPDGIVIAGDSLSTLMRQDQFEAAIDVTCPSCKHEHEIQTPIAEFRVPGTTFSYAQKVFPFCGRFGVGAFGNGLLADKSIYFLMRAFEQKLKKQKPSIDKVTEVAKEVGSEMHNLLMEQLKKDKVVVDDLPEKRIFVGFQVVGYDNYEPKTLEVLIGKNVRCEVIDQLGCTVSGSQEVAQAIWALYEKNPQSLPPYPVFSLQDAIDYAEFLIRATIDHQRFSQTIPNVGGDIDIALVTPFDGFRWIRQKELGRMLGGKTK